MCWKTAEIVVLWFFFCLFEVCCSVSMHVINWISFTDTIEALQLIRWLVTGQLIAFSQTIVCDGEIDGQMDKGRNWLIHSCPFNYWGTIRLVKCNIFQKHFKLRKPYVSLPLTIHSDCKRVSSATQVRLILIRIHSSSAECLLLEIPCPSFILLQWFMCSTFNCRFGKCPVLVAIGIFWPGQKLQPFKSNEFQSPFLSALKIGSASKCH